MKCFICPKNCGADRDNGEIGACGVDNKIYISRVSLHMWEEPCISGESGSGTVFFYGCPLGCVYCQNSKISRVNRNNLDLMPDQKIYTTDELADAFIKLQSEGANNINLVTPTHYSYQIIDAIKTARNKGLTLPIVYNCSGYEKLETLMALDGLIDIYLTDFKYMNDELAKKYSYVTNYSEIAKTALKEMLRQRPECEFNDAGMMTKGVIVRNLLLPLNVRNSESVVKYVYETYGDSMYLSLMNQYTPMEQVADLAPLNRKVTKREYKRLVDFTIALGAKNVFIQEGDVASESFIPDF